MEGATDETATRKRLRIDPAKTYVAWQGISMTDDDGVPHTVGRGAKLLGSHVLVKKFGAEGFVLEGTPQSEWPIPYDDAVEVLAAQAAQDRKEAEASAKPAISPDTPISELMIRHMAIVSSAAGSCGEGAIVSARMEGWRSRLSVSDRWSRRWCSHDSAFPFVLPGTRRARRRRVRLLLLFP